MAEYHYPTGDQKNGSEKRRALVAASGLAIAAASSGVLLEQKIAANPDNANTGKSAAVKPTQLSMNHVEAPRIKKYPIVQSDMIFALAASLGIDRVDVDKKISETFGDHDKDITFFLQNPKGQRDRFFESTHTSTELIAFVAHTETVERFASYDRHFMDQRAFTQILMQDPQQIAEALRSTGRQTLRKFLTIAALSGQVDAILQKISQEDRNAIVKRFAIETMQPERVSSNVQEDRVALAHAALYAALTTNNADFHTALAQNVAVAYEHAQQDPQKNLQRILYGSIAGYLASVVSDGAVGGSLEGVFQRAAREFPYTDRAHLTTEQLFENNAHTSAFVFYNEADFASWRAQFENKKGWVVRDAGPVIVVEGRTPSQKMVRLVAGKPGTKAEKVFNIAREYNGVIQGIVHRGHDDTDRSSDLGVPNQIDQTFSAIPVDARVKFFYGGSCNAQSTFVRYVAQYPHVHTLGNYQNIARRAINDPVIYTIMENLRSTEKLDWARIQKDLDQKMPMYFGNATDAEAQKKWHAYDFRLPNDTQQKFLAVRAYLNAAQLKKTGSSDWR